MAQVSLDDFAGDVYDPTKEFCGCGSDVVERQDAIDQLKDKHRRTSQMGAGKSGPGQQRNVSEMELYGETIEALQDGADLDDLKAEMVKRAHEAEMAMDSATSDEEDAIYRGERNGADYVVDVLGGSHP